MAHDSLKILLVEDDQTLAEITEFRLELLGYEVNTVGSRDATMSWLDEQLPDVVILDLALNNNEGFDLLNRLSNEERTSLIPVLVFSTIADLDWVQRAYTAGASEFLVTPYDPTNLEEKIERLLAER